MQDYSISGEVVDVARAWKDEEYRDRLPQETIDLIPPNPAGELASRADSELPEVCTQPSCTCYPHYCT